jgi:mono/diheme cytochrome c family protein
MAFSRFHAAIGCALLASGPMPSPAEVTPGEILLSEMNCVACHSVPDGVRDRLASRKSPVLGEQGVRVTPHWLREFLMDPQGTKPGTLMPNMLHGVPEGEKPATVEALVHFLISTQGEPQTSPRGWNAAIIEHGETLYHDLGCVQCHAPTRLPTERANDDAAKAELASLGATSVPLGTNIARKYSLGELSSFLRDPLKSRPGGRMPGMNLSAEEADAIAMFLLREQKPAGEAVAVPGLKFELYEKAFPELPEFDRLTPDLAGTVDRPNLSVARRDKDYAIRFRGSIVVTKAGKYQFSTQSDDGSQLFINGRLVVDNGGVHPAQERHGEIELAPGPHDFLLTYFQAGGEAVLKVRWEGPGIGRQEIPKSAFIHEDRPMTPLGSAAFSVDLAKAAAGASHYLSLQCAKCHGDLPTPTPVSVLVPAAKPLDQIAARQPRGCLSPRPAAPAAAFAITDRQRQVILSTLQHKESLIAALDSDQRIHRTLTTLNCYACHQRGKIGGSHGLRRDYLKSVGEVDLGEEGRIPPSLTGVGAKLQPAWMRVLLNEGGKVRPYMATRMPRFGEANVAHLPHLFDSTDTRPDAQPEPDVLSPAGFGAAKHGRVLTGTSGLSCIACHTFDGRPSLGVPAVDLATTGRRLKWDWFRRYLLDPASLRPGTRMPSFWPAGVAANRTVLNGDTEQQLGALWAYLARQNFTDLPDGLIQGKQEIRALGEAAIYRHFIEGGGPRAIGVGFPEKANLCFDGEDLRLAMIWHGPFIDAAKHRTGRGQGYEKPLGGNVVSLPSGPAFARLDGDDAAWPEIKGRPPGWRFAGYRLDALQRPIFRYAFSGIEVEDYAIAKPGEVDAFFERKLTFQAANPPVNLVFRAASGSKIENQSDGTFVIDDRVRMRFPGAGPRIRAQSNRMELLVPVVFENGRANVIQEIVW